MVKYVVFAQHQVLFPTLKTWELKNYHKHLWFKQVLIFLY